MKKRDGYVNYSCRASAIAIMAVAVTTYYKAGKANLAERITRFW